MNQQISALTVTLQRALDSNYDVIDMDAVLFVISELEGTTITKEQLETTRLAKYINQLRRRTRSESLARRAKNLIKKWREMVIPSSGITQQQQQSQLQPQQQQSDSQLRPISLQDNSGHSQQASSHSQPMSPIMVSDFQYSQQYNLLSYDGHERQLKHVDTSLPEYPSSSFNRKTNTGSANKRSSETEQHSTGLEAARSHRHHSQTYDSHERSSEYMDAYSWKRVGSSGNNRISNTGSANQMEECQQQHLNPTNGVNRNFDDPVMDRTRSKIAKHDKIERNKDYKLKKNSNKTQPINFANFLSTSDDTQSTSVGQMNKSGYLIDDRSHLPSEGSLSRKLENSLSPLDFDHNSNPNRENSMVAANRKSEADSSIYRSKTTNGITRLGPIVELNDSNSNSNLMNTIDISMQPPSPLLYNASICSPEEIETSTEHRKSKKHKKDKKRHKSTHKTSNNSEVFISSGDRLSIGSGRTGNVEETSNILYSCHSKDNYSENLFPPHDSLSNSSLSIFPNTSTNITTIGNNQDNTGGYGGREDEDVKDGHGGEDSDLTFAGKFRNSLNTAPSLHVIKEIQVEEAFNTQGSYSVSNSLSSAQINSASRKSRQKVDDSVVVIESRSCSPFIPLVGCTDDSMSSLSEMVDLNQESEGVDGTSVQRTKTSTRDHHKLKKSSVENAAIKSSPTGNSGLEPVKIPKKRGRKKRLKDAEIPPTTPGTFSAQLFEHSRLLSMASLTSNKKVKTTKELLADIQNRKLGSATSSPTLMHSQSSRVPSPFSETSLQSPSISDACSTNATMSTMARSTPDLQTNLTTVRSGDIDDFASDSNTVPGHKSVQFSGDELKIDKVNDGVAQKQCVSDKTSELLKLLPPIDRSKLQWEINTDTICTCKVREVEKIEVEINTENTKEESLFKSSDSSTIVLNVPTDKISLSPVMNVKPIKSERKEFSILPELKSEDLRPCSSEEISRKPIKSIFDLDYDGDDDFLHSIVEANTSANIDHPLKDEEGKNEAKIKKNIHEKVESVKLHQQKASKSVVTTLEQVKVPPPQIPLVQYEVVEDSNCPAKELYVTQRNKITMYHVNALHNSFIPNVNGNWDHSMIREEEEDTKKLDEITPEGLYKRVVPQYNHIIMDKIPKDLSHIAFTRNYKTKIRKELKLKRLASLSLSPSRLEDGGMTSHKKIKLETDNESLCIGNCNDMKEIKKENLNCMEDIKAFDKIKSDLKLMSSVEDVGNVCNDDGNRLMEDQKSKMESEVNWDSALITMDDDDDAMVTTVKGQKVLNSSEFISATTAATTNNFIDADEEVNCDTRLEKNISRRSSSCSSSSSNHINLNRNLSNNRNFIKNNNHTLSSDGYENDNSTGHENENQAYSAHSYYSEDHYDDDEDEEDYNNDGFHHEVVTHDITSSTSTTSEKHIVLTIKKKPVDSTRQKVAETVDHHLLNTSVTSPSSAQICSFDAEIDEDYENDVNVIANLSNGNVRKLSKLLCINDTNETDTVNISTNSDPIQSDSLFSICKTVENQFIDNNDNNMAVSSANAVVFSDKENLINSDSNSSSIVKIEKDDDMLTPVAATATITKSRISAGQKGINEYDNDNMEVEMINEENQWNGTEDGEGGNDSNMPCSGNFQKNSKLEHFKGDKISSEDVDNIGNGNFNDNDNGNSNDFDSLPTDNNALLGSFNSLNIENQTGIRINQDKQQKQQFKEWHEVHQVRSYNDELLTILPYVVID